MGVIAGYTSVPPDLLERCRRDADYFWQILGVEIDRPAESRCLYLDEAWDGITYLISEARRAEGRQFNKPTDLLSQAVQGMEEVNKAAVSSDMQVRHVPAQVVQQAAAVLKTITAAALRKHFEPEQMNAADVYLPSPWQRDDFPYLSGYFDELQAFYAAAAEAGHAVIVNIG